MDVGEIVGGDVEVGGKKIPKLLVFGGLGVVLLAVLANKGKGGSGNTGGTVDTMQSGDTLSAYLQAIETRLGNEGNRQYSNLNDFFRDSLGTIRDENRADTESILDKIDDIIVSPKPGVDNTPINQLPTFPGIPKSWKEYLERQNEKYQKWFKSRPENVRLDIIRAVKATGGFVSDKAPTKEKPPTFPNNNRT